MLNYIVWLLVVVLYSPVFYYLYSLRWDKVDYTHAYFILPVSLGLTWRKRAELKRLYTHTTADKCFHGLLFTILGVVMFIFGWRQGYLFIYTLSIVPLIFGIVLYLYGTKMAKALSFPIFYLLLLVPPPGGVLDSITLPMRYGISAVTEIVLQSLGYPITRAGLELTIGYHKIFMGAPCSGFRSLITLFSLILAYVYIIKGTVLKKLILTALIIPAALLGNLIRIITLCLITFYFGEEAGQGFFHNFSGIVIFIITISVILCIEAMIDKLWFAKYSSYK